MFCLSITTFFLSSCVDNDYDLNKDIDLTIQVGGDNLTLPASDTEDITLKKIFDLDEGSLIKANADGDYSLYKEGDPVKDSRTKIENVTVDKPTVDPINTDLHFVQAPDMPGQITADIPDDETSETTFEIKKENMPIELLSLTSADALMDININFTTEQMDAFAKGYFLKKGFSIQFPKYLTIINTVTGMVLKNNAYVFAQDTRIKATETYRLPNLKVTKVDFTGFDNIEEGLLPSTVEGQGKNLYIKGLVKIAGSAFILEEDFINIGDGEQKDAKLKANVIMTDMPIDKVLGRVDPKIDNIKSDSPLTFDDLPNFLTDEAVIVDMTNPMIKLEISNEAPVPVFINGIFYANRKDGTVKEVGIGSDNGTSHDTEQIIVEAGGGQGNPTVSKICLSRTGEAPAGYKGIKVTNLNDLIEKIPNDISFNIKASADTEVDCNITLGQEYVVKTIYNVDAPLKFGENLDIVYKDTINDWNSDIKDYEIKMVKVVMDAQNRIPLNLELSAIAIDKDYNEIPGITAVVEGNVEPGWANDVEMTETKDITVTLTAKEGEMKILDGLLLIVNANNKQFVDSQNKILNENQTLKLNNIRIKIPGGIIADLN